MQSSATEGAHDTPAHFRAVGAHDLDFHQVDDAEVLAALRFSAAPGSTPRELPPH